MQSQSTVVGFIAEPFRQMIYLDPASINDQGNEGLGPPGTGLRVPAPSSKAAEVEPRRSCQGRESDSVARKERTPSSFGDSGHRDRLLPFVDQGGSSGAFSIWGQTAWIGGFLSR